MKANTGFEIINITTDGDIADALGALRARIKTLKDQQAFYEGLLKEKHITEAEGETFRVTISYDVATSRVDWKSIAEKLGASQQRIAGNTNVTYSDRVRVTAKTK